MEEKRNENPKSCSQFSTREAESQKGASGKRVGEATNAFLSCVSWRNVAVRRSLCGEPVMDPRTRAPYLGLGHAVQMQIPPVGHVRQQAAVVDGVAVQVHTLGLDQQNDIWRGGSNVSEKLEDSQ